MLYHVLASVAGALNRHKKSVNGSRVLVLGIAYKKDIDDLRESPSLTIIELLQKEGAYRRIVHEAQLVVDTRNATRGIASEKIVHCECIMHGTQENPRGTLSAKWTKAVQPGAWHLTASRMTLSLGFRISNRA